MSWRGRQSGPAQPFRDSLRSDRTAPVPSALVSLLPAQASLAMPFSTFFLPLMKLPEKLFHAHIS